MAAVDGVSARVEWQAAEDGDPDGAPEDEPVADAAPAAASPGPEPRSTTRIKSLVMPFLAGQRRRMALLTILAILGGFAEAGALVVIARVAVELAAKNSKDTIDVAGTQISLSTLILVALGLVVIRTLLAVWQARLNALATTTTLSNIRKRIVKLFLGASWALQSSEREGRIQELLTTYAGMASNAIVNLVVGVVSACSIVTLVVTAFVVNPIASIAVAAA